jgi:hypothetical protein
LNKPRDNPISVLLPATFGGVDLDEILSNLLDQLAGHIAPPQEELDALMNKLIEWASGEHVGTPDELAAAIEPTAPNVAEKVRSLKNPEAVLAYINILTAIMQLILLFSNTLHHPPPPGTTQQIVFNIQTTNVTNLPPPPAPPECQSP